MLAVVLVSLAAGIGFRFAANQPPPQTPDSAPFFAAVSVLSTEPVAHYSGLGREAGVSWDLDVTSGGEQLGTVSVGGERISLLSVGGKTYIKAPPDLLASLPSSDTADSLRGKWITGDETLGDMLPQGLQEPQALAQQLWSALSAGAKFPAVGTLPPAHRTACFG
jgi:hypothetical protein